MNILILITIVALILFLLFGRTKQPNSMTESHYKLDKFKENWDDITSSLIPKKADLATPIRAWAKRSLADEAALQQRLLSLPDENLQIFGEKISEFCEEMDIQLDWVINPDADVPEKTKQHAENVVIDYCKLCLRAVEERV
jgi:Sec-independent protein translocase protein TatA